jgi:O-antigen/teichoic acid export membrane protein
LEKYIEGKQAPLILMVGQLLAFFLSCCDIFEYDGKAKYIPSRLDFCGSTLLLNIILIPMYSMTGAAIAFVMSLFLFGI